MEAFEVLLKNLSSYDINDVADIIAEISCHNGGCFYRNSSYQNCEKVCN